LADTSRLLALHQYNWEGFVFSKPDSAIQIASQSMTYAQQIKAPFFVAKGLNTIGVAYYMMNNMDSAIVYYQKSIDAMKKVGDLKEMSTSLNNLGLCYQRIGEFETAITNYKKGLIIKQKIKDKKGEAGALINIGSVNYERGSFAKAIIAFTDALKAYEAIKNERGMVSCMNNIGAIYVKQGQHEQASKYFSRSLKICKKNDDKGGLIQCYSNLGAAHASLKDFDEAIKYFTNAKEVSEEVGHRTGVASNLNNIGKTYFDQGIFIEAFYFYIKSLQLYRDIDDARGIAIALNNIGRIHLVQNNYTKANSTANEAHMFALKAKNIEEIMNACDLLYLSTKATGKRSEALKWYEEYIAARDSLFSEENHKEVVRQGFKYAYEKQAASDSIKNLEAQKVSDALLAAEYAENKQQRQRSYFLYIGLFIALLFGGFIFNRFRVTSKQNVIIEEQKSQVDQAFSELEEKNHEILDSINYAKRIQSAILPPSKVVKEYLKDSFILYKPKDIVAGDFYWLEHKGNKVLFAAADCTGHGVPGAMVSVVCNNALNRSVREHGLTDPAQILDKTREIVINEFEKSDDKVKDGMDIALCSLEGMKLRYAGAHNPLLIIRNGEIIETKANKQPIGQFDNPKPYTAHSFDLEQGDSLYIFSDGYVDQFGGEKGKKFKSKAFRELLLSIQDKSMEDQKIIIDETFETWKGSLEQIDDVCVIGVRV
jgi:serine phosphatase RsbU (regulator of sigma subunit)/Tfp pilus assembly protein PilF